MPHSGERYRRGHEAITGQIGVDVRVGQAYPAYRDSGVEWLGQVPAHWAVVPLKRVGWFCSGAGFPLSAQGSVDGEFLFAKVSDMNRSENDRQIVSAANSVTREVARKLRAYVFPPGTIIFPKVGGALLTNKRRILLRETCIDNNLMGCVVTGAETEFAFRVLQWLDLGGMAKPGPVPAIGEREVREVRVQLPPRSEQTAIARFLDHVDRRIQRYIHGKEKLIELLEEQQQAIIHQAVTGEIDVGTSQPYPAYKDSGVDWLGKVPEHWEVLPLKRWVSTKITDGPHETPDFLPAGVPFLSAEAVSDGHLDFSRRRGFISRKVHEMYCTKCRPQRDDIFMCKSGATTGKVAMVETDDEFSVWSPLALIRVDAQRVMAKLLFRVLQSRYVQGQVRDTWSYGTQPNLAMRTMERLVIALPLLEEQRAILGCLDGPLSQSYRSADLARREIDLVREYWTRLIADVVTGKLDVREEAAALHDIGPLDTADTQDTTPESDGEPETGPHHPHP